MAELRMKIFPMGFLLAKHNINYLFAGLKKTKITLNFLFSIISFQGSVSFRCVSSIYKSTTMTTALRSLCLIMFGILMATCQKELSNDTGSNPVAPSSEANITASVAGRIIDELGVPVKGAVVYAGIVTTTTNINGEFTFTNVALYDKAAYIKVEKQGYFTGSRTFIARQGQKHNVYIQLIPKTKVGTVAAPTGGTITTTNGSAITLAANSVVVESNGAAYIGNVDIAMAWIDPTSANLTSQMPGDLRGIDATNQETGMQSYGMLAVELTGSGGEKLQIAAGKKASLKFPLPASIQGAAPATIALWSFNETTGLWKQEGTATKSGNVYMADVAHFSYWNCDAPFPESAYFSATFVDQNNQPIQNVHVYISKANGVFTGAHGIPDGSGYLTGRLPANEALVLNVELYGYQCQSGIMYSQNIGPFATGSTNNLGTITINTGTVLSNFTISGTAVNCNNAPITDGFADIRNGYSVYRANITNGAFSVSFYTCVPTATTISYLVVDYAASQQSSAATKTVSPGTTSLGTVAACGTATTAFINFTIDGAAHSLVSPADSTIGYNLAPGAIASQIRGYTGNQAMFSLFSFSGVSTGSFPLTSINLRAPGMADSVGVNSATPINVSVTEYGPVGGFIAGSFSGTLIGYAVPTHTIQCSFRVPRRL
jgi:hypothetical protein